MSEIIKVRRFEDKSLFVAVGESGKISTSVDGITWTSRTSNCTNTLRDVTLNDDLDLIVVCGDGGDFATSSDGVTWTKVSNNISDINITGVVYSSVYGTYVITGGDSGKIFTSQDGAVWVERYEAEYSGALSPNFEKWIVMFEFPLS